MSHTTTNSSFSALLGSQLLLSVALTAAFGDPGCDLRSHSTRPAAHQRHMLTFSAQPDSPEKRTGAASKHQL